MSTLFRLLILSSLMIPLHAESWSTTSFLYLYGEKFDQVAGSDRVRDGRMTTYTLEHAGEWEYGSNFFFIDMSQADFESNDTFKTYAEWAPALSLYKLFDRKTGTGLIKDILVAGELDQGNNFQATLLGMRLALNLPGFNFFDMNLFSRKDNYNDPTYQVTLAWNTTFSVASIPLIFEGFVDYYGVDFGTETLSQPRLFIDGKLYGMKNLHIGVELYYYRSSKAPWREKISESLPQFTLKWVW